MIQDHATIVLECLDILAETLAGGIRYEKYPKDFH